MAMSRPKVKRTDEEWRAVLAPATFHIAREGGTEPAFSGMYWDSKTPGLYRCRCCEAPLFESTTKYDSGSGWPSFTRPVADDAVTIHEDRGHGMTRTEVRCAACEAHLGHVFPDGPRDGGGMRYCINSAVLDLTTVDDDS
jgi:peptide-methionine (R)-S-oxide reductase